LNNASLLGGNPGSLLGSAQKIEDLSDDEKSGLARWNEFQKQGTGYFAVHGTVPYVSLSTVLSLLTSQTVAVVLSTSPLATIFWLSEKIFRWSSPNTTPSLDFAIANCLLYWFSGSMTSCLWHYYLITNNSDDMQEIFKTQIHQPAAIGVGPFDFGWVG
jgi:hypothetical protein